MSFIDLSEESLGANIDELDAWDGSGGIPDPGDYQFEIAEVKDDPSAKAKPMLTIQSAIVSNADGSPTPMAGRTIFSRYMLKADPNTKNGNTVIKRLKAFLFAIGKLGEGFESEELVGLRYCGTVYHEPYTVTDDTTGMAEERMGARLVKERPLDDGTQVDEQATSDAGDPNEVIEEEPEAAPTPPPAKKAATTTAKPTAGKTATTAGKKTSTPPPKVNGKPQGRTAARR